MKTLLLVTLLFLFALSCSWDKGADNSKTASNDSVKIPTPPGTQMTKEFKDIDTVIYLSFYKLTPYAIKLSSTNKMIIINKALKSAHVDHPGDYKLKDFYCIDFDNDNDIDLIYSSNTDQYKLMDTNFLLLLQNDNDLYKQYKIPGYLYQADFSKWQQKQIILKTVSRPCCDYLNYNFYETSFNTKTWTLNTKHVLEINDLKVHEK